MYSYVSKIRVRYCETDQMGYLHHANYAKYYEEARTDAMRNAGYTYKQCEQDGIMMPVMRIESRYLKPAFYDELITIHTHIKTMPRLGMFTIHHEFINEKNEITHTATVTLAVIDTASGKRRQLPEIFHNYLKQHIHE